jgi:RNA polymerase sigma factor (TIGR02999 family)
MEQEDPSPQNDELFAAAYAELRRRARALTRRGRDTPTLDATALVHEAYLKLAGNRRFRAESPQHLTFTVVRAMRFVLVDAARRRTAAIRGGGAMPLRRVPLDDSVAQAAVFDPGELLAMNLALRTLGETHEAEARAFELQFFGGLAVAEIAVAMELSEKRVQRLLRFARALLARMLASADDLPE